MNTGRDSAKRLNSPPSPSASVKSGARADPGVTVDPGTVAETWAVGDVAGELQAANNRIAAAVASRVRISKVYEVLPFTAGESCSGQPKLHLEDAMILGREDHRGAWHLDVVVGKDDLDAAGQEDGPVGDRSLQRDRHEIGDSIDGQLSGYANTEVGSFDQPGGQLDFPRSEQRRRWGERTC